MSKKQNLPTAPGLARTIGPSFILLGLALGSGELILWPYLAANYGLGLLWGALLGVSFQFILNTEVMRYSLAWGESVFMGFRRMSVLLTIWYIFSTFIPWSLPGFSSASAEIINNFIPSLPITAVAISLLLLTGLILSSGKTLYRTIEVFQKTIILLGLPFLFFVAFALSSGSDWQLAVQGLIGMGEGYWFFPNGVAIAAFLGAFAYSGAGGNLNLAQSYYIKEKGFGMGAFSQKITSLFAGKAKPISLEGQTFPLTTANRRKWANWWRLVNQEHFLVFWILSFVTIVILSVFARASVFHQATESGMSFLYLESEVIAERLGQTFGWFFLLIAAVTLFSTQVGVLESSSRIISENILLLFYKKGKKVNASNWFYWALWGQIGLGIVVYLGGFTEPRVLLTLSAVLNAAAMMSSFLFIWILNTVRLPKELHPPLWRTAVMGAAFLFFLFFLGITTHEFIQEYLVNFLNS